MWYIFINKFDKDLKDEYIYKKALGQHKYLEKWMIDDKCVVFA